MRVDALLRLDTETPHQIHFAVRGEIEECPLPAQRLDHCGVRQGLQRVVQIDVRQGGGEAAVLPAHAFDIDYEQR